MVHVHYLPRLDPLTLVLYLDATHVGRDVTKEPMLEEFAASLAITRSARAPTLGAYLQL